MENKRRMYLQELAILSLVRRGEAYKKELSFGRTIYKLKCENPWEKTQTGESMRDKLPQEEIKTGFQ